MKCETNYFCDTLEVRSAGRPITSSKPCFCTSLLNRKRNKRKYVDIAINENVSALQLQIQIKNANLKLS